MAHEYFHGVATRESRSTAALLSRIIFSKFRMKLSNIPPPPLSAEWFDSGSNSKLLQDLDKSSVMEEGRKKLNTVSHYQVCVICVCVCVCV